jgi:Ser/Thr protein kinase RdoA (MazF antagonist)
VIKPFHQATYISQVRRLRKLAEVAIGLYPVKYQSIDFIRHGENATFCVTANNKRKYLLRIHRSDYHTPQAIQEELAWLDFLAKDGTVPIPKPVPAKNGRLLQEVTSQELTRNCCLFEWIEGRFIRKGVQPNHLFMVGQVIAELQSRVPRSKINHRNYWNAEGLVGNQPKFGSIDNIKGIRTSQQKPIRAARKLIFKRLRNYERKFPRRMGLIHADLHFGNILLSGNRLVPIDFDDCGCGFHVYDLAVSLYSVQSMLGPKNKMPEFRRALIEGYKTSRPFDRHDEMILEDLLTARRLLMLGWLNSRSDNPRLKKVLKGAVGRVARHARSVLKSPRREVR